MNLGNKIKTLRKQNNLTQENLAEMLGVSYQAISRWENNITSPDISTLPILANIFDVTVDYLLDVNILKNEETINKIYDEYYNLSIDNKLDECETLLENTIKQYPYAFKLKNELLHIYYIKLFDNEEKNFYQNKIINLANNIIEKDLQCEHLFEDATNYLFEKMLLNKPLTLTGSEHPDGKLSFKDKYIMWDNKSKETAVNLKDHIQQFERYIKTSDKDVTVFMVIAPDFTPQSVQECVDFSLNNDTQILLITAEELKTVAEIWVKKNPGEIFNLGYFKQNGRFDIKLLNL